MPATRAKPKRRLPPAERRAALIEAATEVAAAEGYDGLTLEAVAEAGGVTRNLLYHYFPGGRRELYLAVIEHGARRIADEWVTDPEVPLPERVRANFNRIVDYAISPTAEWALLRQANASLDPEVRAIGDALRATVIANIAQNNLGTDDPPPLVRAAISGFIDYGQAALDEWKGTGVPRAAIVELLVRTLAATIEVAVEATEAGRTLPGS